MGNPILNMIGSMSNLQNALNIYGQLKSGNTEAVYNQMMSNPQFKQFVEANKGKTPEQIARENNIDLSILNKFR